MSTGTATLPTKKLDGDTGLVPVRCKGCRRTVAWASHEQALRNSIFCSRWCAENPPATDKEARNDEWRLRKSHGVSVMKMAEQDGVAFSLIYKVLNKD